VTPASFELSGKANVQISIEIPATTPPGTYPILVSVNAAGSPPAQATITVHSLESGRGRSDKHT
jgi:hypothetical protein